MFGPILHIYRYDPADLADVAGKLADRRYGLTLGVHSRIERFAQEIRALEQRGIGFRSLTESIDTTTSGGRLVFHIFAALAEFERSIIRERVA